MTASDGSGRRLVAVDLARLVALVGMMGAHTMLAAAPPPALVAVLDGPPSTLFAVLGGVSVVLASRARLARGDVAGAMRATAVRGALVALIGVAVAPFATAVAVVLAPFGASIAIAALLLAAPTWALVAIAVPLALGGGWVVAWARDRFGWLGEPVSWASVGARPLEALLDVLVTGVYPVVTWSAYLLLGMVLARAWLAARAADRERRALGVVLALGAALVALGVGVSELGLLLAPRVLDVDPALARELLLGNGYGAALPEPVLQLLAAPHTGTPADIARTVGIALLVLAALGLATARLGPRAQRILEPLRATGGAPLSVYVVHVTLLTALLVAGAPAAVATGGGAWALQVAVALAIGGVLAATGGRGWLEWFVSAAAEAVGGRTVGATPLVIRRPDDLSLEYEVRLAAPRDEVWRALTDPEVVPRWLPDPLLPMARAEMDVRAGGRYRWVHRAPLGEAVLTGEYLRVEPPRLLQQTLGREGRAAAPSVTTVRLEEAEGGTLLRATDSFPTRRRRDRAIAGGAGTAAAAYERLAAHLAG